MTPWLTVVHVSEGAGLIPTISPRGLSDHVLLSGAIHEERPHPKGEGGGVSRKRTQGEGVIGKKRASSNSNFYQNFLKLKFK